MTREPGTLADPAVDIVTVDGRPVPAAEDKRYILLHKPRGYVATRHDPQGRAIVTDLVAPGVRLYPVGRLDTDVEGLLLLSNDGELTHRVLHPRYGLPRVYEADVVGLVTAADLRRWRAGVTLADGFAQPLAVEIAVGGERRSSETTRLVLTFAEGRKHEVKRYCDALGHPVVRLRRIAFGPLTLGDLAVGASRDLTRRELAQLRAAVAGAEARAARRADRRQGRSDESPLA